jgi:hypothetical protein
MDRESRSSNYWYLSIYGLTKEQADRLKSCGCDLCGTNDKVYIDFDVATRYVRGPLCHRCYNAVRAITDDRTSYVKALELFGNDASLLQAGVEYLEFHQDFQSNVVDKDKTDSL